MGHMTVRSHEKFVPKETFFNLKPEKRLIIEQAAQEEFAQFGAKGASLNRIVRAAGIAKGSFYQYFEDMDDVLEHLILQLGKRKVAFIEQALEDNNDLDFYAKLSEIYRASIRFFSELTPLEVHFGEQVSSQYPSSGTLNDYRRTTIESIIHPLVVDAVTSGEVTVNVELAYAVTSQFPDMFRQYSQSIHAGKPLSEVLVNGDEFEAAFEQIIAVIKAGLTLTKQEKNEDV